MEFEAAKMIGAGLSMFALIGAGIGIGNIFSTLIASIARNPETSQELFSRAIIGFALTESIALLAFIVSMIILFK